MRNYMVLALLAVMIVVCAAKAAESDELMVSDEGDEVVFREVRSARPKGGNKGGRPSVCRYTKGSWEECDLSSNTRTRSLTLKRGDPSECEQTKVDTRRCKKACRYTKGQWSSCDGSNAIKERIDQLKQGSDASCEPTRKMTKKCKGKAANKN